MCIVTNLSRGDTQRYQVTLFAVHTLSHIGSYHCCFLCSLLIMSQDTVTITVLPVTVLCFGTSSITTTVMMAPATVGPPAALGQQDVVLPPLLILRDTRCCWPCHCAAVATSVPDAFFRHMPTVAWVLHR